MYPSGFILKLWDYLCMDLPTFMQGPQIRSIWRKQEDVRSGYCAIILEDIVDIAGDILFTGVPGR